MLYCLPPLSLLNVHKIIIRDGGDSCPELLCTWQFVVERSGEPQPLHHVSEEDAQLFLCQRVSHANSFPNTEGHHLWKIFYHFSIFDKPFRFKCRWLLPEGGAFFHVVEICNHYAVLRKENPSILGWEQ